MNYIRIVKKKKKFNYGADLVWAAKIFQWGWSWLSHRQQRAIDARNAGRVDFEEGVHV